MLEATINYSPEPIIGHLFNVPLYWYGFFYMVSIVLGYLLVDAITKKINSESSNQLREILPQFTFWIFLWGIVGARLYHVLNEWQFYFEYPELILRLDNGGLAIHGALIGGALYLLWKSKRLFDFKSLRLYGFLWLTDIITPALLLGQAIGRWGNYFNQELYGAPTNGIFKVFIDVNHRITGYENVAHYHPLFFYEMMATGLFALLFYLNDYKKWLKLPKMGSGKLFLSYVVYYSLIRFFLDFLRIDTAIYLFGVIGINQIILILIIIISVYLIRKK